MKKKSEKRRVSGISGAVISMVVMLALILSAMLSAAGCSTDDVLDHLYDVDDADPVTTTQAYSGTVSDSSVLVPTDAEVSVPRDHEDVLFPNYESDYYIVVYTLNCSVLVLGKDENGRYTNTIKTFLCSTGSFDNDTASNNGVYDIVEKHDWRFMMDVYGHYCTRIGKGTGYLFHSVPYLKEKDLQSQSSGYDKLGTNASHGCVRLCSRDAKWIYDNIPYGTQVRILDGKNGPPGEPVPMRIKGDWRYVGWDPTDPNKANPYLKLDPSELTYFTHTSAGTQATTAATMPAESPSDTPAG